MHEMRHQLIPRSEVLSDSIVLPTVWAMRCKHLIKMGEVYKWKVHLSQCERPQTKARN